ncbi:MAG: hypothetical protein PWQ77_1834 [Kosmotogales bacterium]|nr:hypothetical protein [Kosmotogales bacterium]
MLKVFYCGDQVMLITTYVKGMNSWTDGVVHDESFHLKKVLDDDSEIDLTYLPTSECQRNFPDPEEIKKYDVVLFSDVGTDTIIMYEDRFNNCPMGKDRLTGLKKWVENGGGLCGVGGWLSFGGMFGMAKWHNTPLEETLPVTCFPYDDRVELSEGMVPNILKPEHPIFNNVDFASAPPLFSGYNQIVAKKDGEVLAEYNGDPIIVIGNYGKGKTLAFATDPAPHWGRGMVDWKDYPAFWINVVKWLGSK